MQTGPITELDFSQMNVRQRLYVFLQHSVTELINESGNQLSGLEKMLARDASKLVLRMISRKLEKMTDEQVVHWLKMSHDINAHFLSFITDENAELKGLIGQIQRLAGGTHGDEATTANDTQNQDSQ